MLVVPDASSLFGKLDRLSVALLLPSSTWGCELTSETTKLGIGVPTVRFVMRDAGAVPSDLRCACSPNLHDRELRETTTRAIRSLIASDLWSYVQRVSISMASGAPPIVRAFLRHLLDESRFQHHRFMVSRVAKGVGSERTTVWRGAKVLGSKSLSAIARRARVLDAVVRFEGSWSNTAHATGITVSALSQMFRREYGIGLRDATRHTYGVFAQGVLQPLVHCGDG